MNNDIKLKTKYQNRDNDAKIAQWLGYRVFVDFGDAGIYRYSENDIAVPLLSQSVPYYTTIDEHAIDLLKRLREKWRCNLRSSVMYGWVFTVEGEVIIGTTVGPSHKEKLSIAEAITNVVLQLIDRGCM